MDAADKGEIPLSPEQKARVQQNLGLAQKIAHAEYARAAEVMNFDEVLSVAYLGLISASKGWDPSKSSSHTEDEAKAFGWFARTKIVGQIKDWQKKKDHVHPTVRRDYKALCAEGYGTTNLSYEELSRKTKLPIRRIYTVITSVEARPISIEELPDSSLSYDDHTAPDATLQMVSASFARIYDQLPFRQQLVIALRYYSNMGFGEISQETGLHLESIRRAHEEALSVIRSTILNKIAS